MSVPTPAPSPTPIPTEPPTAPPTVAPTASPAPITVGNYTDPFLPDLAQSKAQILADGLTVGVVWPAPDSADTDYRVCLQYPNPGDLVDPGTPVHLFVKRNDEAC